MTLRPSGRLENTPDGQDLILTRTYRAPIEDVWAGITESDRTARWFGPWKGEAGPGRTIQEHDGRTELVFTHHLSSPGIAGEAGPGWEYYLDMLGAALSGTDHPDFADYYPAMRDYYVNAIPH